MKCRNNYDMKFFLKTMSREHKIILRYNIVKIIVTSNIFIIIRDFTSNWAVIPHLCMHVCVCLRACKCVTVVLEYKTLPIVS